MKGNPWRDLCKFLAGVSFMSAVFLFYLYYYDVTLPIFSTGLIQTPEISGLRSAMRAVLFVVFFYFGFIRKPRSG